MNLYNRIVSLCEKAGVAPSRMCKDVGISRSTMTELKSGRYAGLQQKTLAKIADYFSVTVDYLIGSDDLPSNVKSVKLKKLPMLGHIACGEPVYTDQEYNAYVSVDDDIDADFCLTCEGDSMIGAGIIDGDVILLKAMPLVPNGKIAAVQVGDEATLKKWEYYPEKNMLILTPYNPKYRTQVYQGEELNSIRCLGLAVDLVRRIK